MRICDICFGEIEEGGAYEIEDGIRKDYCSKCVDRLNNKSTNQNTDKLIKEYTRFFDEKEENIERLISKIRKESRNKYDVLLLKG